MKQLILLSLIGIVGICGVFAQEPTWFGATSLQFLSGSTWITGSYNLESTLDEGATGFWVRLLNPTQDAVQEQLVLVNQQTTDDGKSSCDMAGGSAFGQYLQGNLSVLTVPAGSSVDQWIGFSYPACMSGLFQGCLVHRPVSDYSMGSVDVVLGKVNFLNLTIHPSVNCQPFVVKAYPGSRAGGNYTNNGELRVYSAQKVLLATGVLGTNSFGSGGFSTSFPSGTYYIVYKGQSHLASYLSGIYIEQGVPMVLDFTTGVNLYNVQNKSESQNDGYRYQIAGDLKSPITAKYDFVINGNDVSSLVYGSGANEVASTILDPKNLNGDTVINGADIGVIGINYLLADPFASNSVFPR